MLKLTLNKKAKVNLKGQVILENAIVFVSLAIIAVSAMYLFAKLNKNIINRIEVFRNSRKPALNSNNYIPPLDFIHRGNTGSICPDLGLGMEGFDSLYRDDPLMREAELLELRSNLIFTKVLPYNINLVRVLAEDIKTKPREKRDTIQNLIVDAKRLINENTTLKRQARDKFKLILNEPVIPGMYDPDPQNHPELYKLDPATQPEEIKSLQAQNETNRQSLKDMIKGLEDSEAEFLDTVNKFIFPNLDFISSSIEQEVSVLIGEYSYDKYLLTKKEIQENYNKSVKLLNETFTDALAGGGIWVSINDPYIEPVFRGDLANLSLQLKGDIVKDDLISAKAFISQMRDSYILLGDGQPAGGSDGEVTNDYLQEAQQAHDLILNNPNPTEEELKEIQEILSNVTKNTFQSAPNDNIIKELIDKLDEKLEEAVWAWESWEAAPVDREGDIQKKEIYKEGKDYAVDVCALYAEIISRLTQPSVVYDYCKGKY